jgi:flagellar motility protein MotE (MotC chaperone)
MKTILTAGVAGVILFAISASVSWYLVNQKQEVKKEEMAHENGPEEDAGVPPMGKGVEKKEQLPVAIRPDVPLSVEAVLQLSESIRKKELELQAREKSVEKTEQNIKLLFEDLKLERAELTAMMEGLEAKLKLAQIAVGELKQENQAITTKSQELAKLVQEREKKKPGEGEVDTIGERVKTVKAWFEGLDDEQAANYLKEFANSGESEFAMRLLMSLQHRKASKILAALNDPDFFQELMRSLPSEKKEHLPTDGDISGLDRIIR